ncbi:MAG: hypothetical protein JW804_04825 [Sedimentisphaerales bacterium]|nr:hypothetical protein [Sedimentisphaerales bacterium]
MKKQTIKITALWILGICYFLVVILSLAGVSRYAYKRYLRKSSLLKSWHTCEKIMVIEGDDWGRSGLTKKQLGSLAKQLGTDEYILPLIYNTHQQWLRDSMETENDLEMLYKVLEKYRDKRGRHPVFTANVIVSNPNLEAIKNNGYTEYIATPVSEAVVDKWKEGMSRRVFYPQYHGYTHFNQHWWLRTLQYPNSLLRKIVEMGIVRLDGITHRTNEVDFTGEYVDCSVTPSVSFPREYQEENIKTGLAFFENMLGYKSKSTIAPFYIWDDTTEALWNEYGIKYIQCKGQYTGKDKDGFWNKVQHMTGERNKNGQIYLVRNCHLEVIGENPPRWKDTVKWIEFALSKKLPVTLETHRLNYVSGVDPHMQQIGLEAIDSLLEYVTKRHPDILFLTSPELGDLIETGQFKDVFTGENVRISSGSWSRLMWFLRTRSMKLMIAGLCLFLLQNIAFIYVFKTALSSLRKTEKD